MSALHQLQPTSPHAFRAAMGRFVTGVSIVTSLSDAGLVGMTANSLTSVSLNPCLLLVCLRKGSVTGAAIRAHGRFAVNLLAEDQEELALRFAKPADDRFKGTGFTLDEHGVPLIEGCTAHIACELHSVHEAGDHDIFFGNAVGCTHDSAVEPLVFRGGHFGTYLPRVAAAG